MRPSFKEVDGLTLILLVIWLVCLMGHLSMGGSL